MIVQKRNPIDVELTNRCNALCNFCPRDMTPEQGFMSFETFKQVIARVKALDNVPSISMTGQGESTLHRQLEDFTSYANNQGVRTYMTTNANLLDREMSRKLLDAGLWGIVFSVSDFGEDYELVYNLNWETTRKNILDFLDLKEKYTDRNIVPVISIVEHDLNKDKIEGMKAFWNEAGIKFILENPQNNRGGACDNAHFFLGNDRYREEARRILAENGASALCSAPFHFVFIGWNGQYYICCSDYKKESPLGSVFDYSIQEMDQIKLEALSENILPACQNCNVDPVNAVRERLFDLEQGLATRSELNETVEHYRVVNNRRLPEGIDILNVDELEVPQ